MSMRPLLVSALCLAALAVAACDGDSVRISSTHTENPDAKGPLKVVKTLQCPQTIGSLTRKGSASAEGSVCTYAGPRGSEVSLHLVKLDGATPAAALKAFEDRLSTALPLAVEQLKASAEEVTATASITYSFERLERLEEYYGPGWFGTVMDAMEPPRPATIRKVLEVGLDGAEVDQVL